MIVQGNFTDLLEPGVREIFDTDAGRPLPVRDALYRVVSSAKAEDHYTGLGSRRLVPAYEGTLGNEDFDQYYKTTLSNILFVDGLQVERSLLEDEQYGEIRTRSEQFAGSFPATQDQDAADIFINAFTDSGTDRTGASTNGADSVGLCSTAHPYSPAQSGSTQSNEGTLALSMDNAESTMIAMRKFTTDRGRRMNVNPDLVVVPPDLQRDAQAIFPRDARVVWEPGSAEFNANMFATNVDGVGVRVVVWNLLSDVNAWFMIDSRLMRQHLIWQERVPISLGSGKLAWDEESVQFVGRMRYARGHTHWSWIYGQNPS